MVLLLPELTNDPRSRSLVRPIRIFLQASQDKRKKGQVVVPVAAKYPNVIHIKFNVINAIKDQVHFLGSDVRGFTDAHRQPAIAVEPKGSSKGAEDAGGFIKKKGVVLHRDIKFGEELVSGLAIERSH